MSKMATSYFSVPSFVSLGYATALQTRNRGEHTSGFGSFGGTATCITAVSSPAASCWSSLQEGFQAKGVTEALAEV